MSNHYALKYNAKSRNHKEKYEYILQNKFVLTLHNKHNKYNIKTNET